MTTTREFAEAEYVKWVARISSLVPDGASTSNLTTVAKHLFGDKFVGVFARNTMPKLEKGQYLIFNLDTSDKSGSHWVALTTDLVYDSYGQNLKHIVQTTPTDPDAEQTNSELNCGARCIAFLAVYDTYGPKVARYI
jgi:hypothetical protein